MLLASRRQSEPLVFLHIPKTAGISFRRMLKFKILLNHPRSLVNVNLALGFFRIPDLDQRFVELARLDGNQRTRIHYVEGHQGYGVDDIIRRKTRYLTLLRNPVDRAKSTYYHLQRPDVKARHGVPDLGLVELVFLKNSWGDAHYFDNCQVRYLAGDKGKPVALPFGECTRSMLERAKERVEQITFVGLTEFYEESVALLCRTLGWSFAPVIAANRTSGMGNEESLAPSEASLLKEINELDLELYSFAQARFRRDLEGATHRIKVLIERNRKLSRGLAPLISP